MMNSNKADDEFLLQNDFNRLLLNKQPKIRHIISVGVRKGFFTREEAEDVEQEINLRLLEKAEHLCRNYNGLSTVDAYLQVIIFNECRQYARNQHQIKDRFTDINENIHQVPDHGLSPEDELVIQYEANRLEVILKLYPRQRCQLEFFIKLLCRIPVNDQDISAAYPGINPKFCQTITERINSKVITSIIETYRVLCHLLDEAKIEHPKPDSLLHSVKDKIKQIIELLNSKTKHRSKYEQDSFLILAEEYFSLKTAGNKFQFVTFLGYIITATGMFNNL